MRARWQVLGAAVLVTATAVVSTAVAVRHADATDARLRAAALAKVRLSLVPPPDETSLPGDSPTSGYGVSLRNDGTEDVVVERAFWDGEPALELGLPLATQGTQDLVLPDPPTCPAHRVTQGLDHLDVQVEVAGGRRTVRLPLPDPAQAREQVNNRCGLVGAADSVGTNGVDPVQVRAGELVLDVQAVATGAQPTQVVAVRAAAGVRAQVVEALPLTVPPASPGGGLVPHLLRVRLTLTDCAPIRQSVDPSQSPGATPEPGMALPPRYFELQLVVRHPGEPVEETNLIIQTEAANAFATPCGVPVLRQAV